ncbi:MAG: metal-dependent hydrolase [Pedobacter sp.]|nr:metal-dependent hydrolase [Pedobacter sp.]
MTTASFSSSGKAPGKRLAGATVGIPPRQMDFRFPADSRRYFFDDNAFASMFFATLSGFFPPGERFFVESVRHYRDRISDPVMKAKISGFIGQEAIHGREHDRLNEMLTRRGIKVWFADRAVKVGLGFLEKFSPSQQLACTIFMEHFTALLAEQLLTDERFRARADAEIIPLWMWHAVEELEHKAVAYDVYQQVSGSYAHRVLAVPLTAVALTPMVVASMAWLLNAEGQIFNREDRARGWKFLFARRGFVARIMPKMGDFLARDFHPDNHDTTALVQEWQDKLFGPNGRLLEEFRNREALMH